MKRDNKKICGLCQSTFWYTASVLVFVLVTVATVMAKGTGQFPFQGGEDAARNGEVVDEGNPAPSITLHYVGAKWCGPCKQVKPILKDLAKAGYNIKFYDIDEDPEAPKPTKGAIPYFRWDRLGKVVDHDTGGMSRADFVRKFERLEQ